MNEKNNDNNAEEEEMNELPGYIQSIINDFYSFDKKEIQDKKEISETNPNPNSEQNLDKKETKETEKINEDEDINEQNIENDLDNMDMDLENIFNSKKDFFNEVKKETENNKENIDNNITNKIKLYSIQENNLFNIKRSFRLQSILQNNYIGFQNNTLECSICYRKIQNYGLLSNCDDVFCYDCIKQWRTEAISKNKREMFRRCPICNFESPMLIKSKNYVSGEEKKKKFYELKENINNNDINKDNNSNKNNLNIKLYCVQENNLLNIKRSLRLQSILQNNLTGYQNNTYECSICFRRIQNYGLLSNCDDVFCYDCIKQWRTEAISKNKREMFRRCPICNCESPMLIKSKNYVSGEEKRTKFYELKQGKKISQINQ